MGRADVGHGVGVVLIVAVLLLGAGSGEAGAEEAGANERRGYEFTGVYGQVGGSLRLDQFGGGATASAGYRFLPWLAVDVNATYLANGFYGVAVGPKIYPLGAASDSSIPEFVQPYGVVGIGADVEDETIAGRFGVGVDFWLTDRLGFFTEAGTYLYREHPIASLSLGAQIRF